MTKIAKLLVMALMTPTLLYAQTATNSIYIDQVGNSSTIVITQKGQTNSIGTENARFKLEGSNQNVNIEQNGNGNSILGSIKQADNIAYDIQFVGDNNVLDIDHGTAASVAGSQLTLHATGNMNNFNLMQGDNASSTSATQTITVTGDSNSYTSKINADDVIQTTTVSGDSNTIDILQNGHASKNLDMILTGNQNNITIQQKSTVNVDRLSVTSQSNGSTMSIKQCTSGC